MSLGEKMFHGHYEVGPDPIFCPQNVDLTLDLVFCAGSSSPPKAAHRSLLDGFTPSLPGRQAMTSSRGSRGPSPAPAVTTAATTVNLYESRRRYPSRFDHGRVKGTI